MGARCPANSSSRRVWTSPYPVHSKAGTDSDTLGCGVGDIKSSAFALLDPYLPQEPRSETPGESVPGSGELKLTYYFSSTITPSSPDCRGRVAGGRGPPCETTVEGFTQE